MPLGRSFGGGTRTDHLASLLTACTTRLSATFVRPLSRSRAERFSCSWLRVQTPHIYCWATSPHVVASLPFGGRSALRERGSFSRCCAKGLCWPLWHSWRRSSRHNGVLTSCEALSPQAFT